MQASSRRPIGLQAPRSGPCAGRAQALDLDVGLLGMPMALLVIMTVIWN
jgi:hypothetical protein